MVDLCAEAVKKVIEDASDLLRILEEAETEDISSTLGCLLARFERLGANIWFHNKEPYLEKLIQEAKHAESSLHVVLSLLSLREPHMGHDQTSVSSASQANRHESSGKFEFTLNDVTSTLQKLKEDVESTQHVGSFEFKESVGSRMRLLRPQSERRKRDGWGELYASLHVESFLANELCSRTVRAEKLPKNTIGTC